MDIRLQNEIDHGKKIASLNSEDIWNWNSAAGKERFKRRADMLRKHLQTGMNVLEVGCGTGLFTKELIKTGAKITAIDISPDLLNLAKQNIPKASNLRFKLGNAYEMTFPNQTFDLIVGSSILHHLDIPQALNEIRRVLKPKGKIVFTEPNMLNPQIFLERRISFLRRLLCVSPDETAFIRWKLKKRLESSGFHKITIIPFDFLHPQTPKMLIPAIKKIGFQLENIPIIKEIAGSLYISAVKIP